MEEFGLVALVLVFGVGVPLAFIKYRGSKDQKFRQHNLATIVKMERNQPESLMDEFL